MKMRIARALSLLLALVFVLSCFAGCGTNEEGGEKDTSNEANTEAATENALDIALSEVDVDWGKKEFAILAMDGFKGEVYGENGIVDADGGSSQVINDAVYERNCMLEDKCNLKFSLVLKSAADVNASVTNEATTASGDFYMIDTRMADTATFAVSGKLYNLIDLGVDLEQPWWDQGTADFALAGKVFFMTGDVNWADDNLTYVLIFNKKMAKEYNIADPYTTVKNWEWTLPYFNTVIQNISSDANGDGKMNELDKYGFITTWEYGNTFFLASDLRYIDNSRNSDAPTLVLSEQMDKALNVLDLSQQIYHNNDASYMSPPGKENLGLTAFKENRGLFYGEVADYLSQLNKDMDGDYGVLPVPKYDKAQEFYRTWTHESGSCLSVTSAVGKDIEETVGDIVTAYAILSSKKVQPAYYDIMLTSRNVRDAESAEMLDIIFQNRVYDLAFYFTSTFTFYPLFKESVNNNDTKFSSKYASASKNFDKKINKLLKSLES